MKGSTGFKVYISISCETEEEILTHMSIARQQIKSVIRKNKGELELKEREVIKLEDSNCYGDHTVTIQESF